MWRSFIWSGLIQHLYSTTCLTTDREICWEMVSVTVCSICHDSTVVVCRPWNELSVEGKWNQADLYFGIYLSRNIQSQGHSKLYCQYFYMCCTCRETEMPTVHKKEGYQRIQRQNMNILDVFCIFYVSFWSKFWSFCCSRTFVWVISRVKWKKSVLNSVCNPFLLIFLNFLALLFIVWCNRIHSSLLKQMLYDPDLYFMDTPVFQFRWLVLMESLMLI